MRNCSVCVREKERPTDGHGQGLEVNIFLAFASKAVHKRPPSRPPLLLFLPPSTQLCFLASCAPGSSAVDACPLSPSPLVQNMPLSQSPIISAASCAWKRALRPREGGRGGGLRKVRQAPCSKKKKCASTVPADRTDATLPLTLLSTLCPNSETASIHSTKAIHLSFLPSFLPSLPGRPGCLPAPTWPVSESYSHCLCERARSLLFSAYLPA